MPQKQNPVGPSVLVAIARQSIALSAALQGAGVHRQQRDGAAWFTEWLALPQLCILSARALALAVDLVPRVQPNPAAMQRGLDADHGVILAEALVFALTRLMPRPEAQAAVKALCVDAARDGVDLLALATRKWPGGTWADRVRSDMLGQAPAEALAFAQYRKPV